MKNPNRYGSVSRLSGNRRKPWVVREGLSGHQRAIGYASTREEGLILLAEYNKSPWDIDTDKFTLKQLYELWLEKRAPKLGNANRRALVSVYRRYLADMGHLRYNQIKSYQMQDVIDSCGYGYSTQSAIKNLWRHLDKFGMELDIIQKRYSDLLTSDPIPATSKGIFSTEEINTLWEYSHVPWVDSVLFFLYTGFRISEMMELKVSNVDFSAQIMKGGGKTEAGKDRIVPIHSKIRDIVEHRAAASGCGYLFEYNGCPLYDSRYRMIWNDLMGMLSFRHTPHECRHTFRSELDSKGANKVCIDRIMGHKSQGTGERVYTHKSIEELKQSIELVTYS